MTRRTKLWWVGAALFTLINVGGAVVAALSGEGMHTGVHVGLTLIGAYLVWRLAPRAGQELPQTQAGDRLEYLQESVDAIALEVERIGEAQRFDAKLREKRPETSPPKEQP